MTPSISKSISATRFPLILGPVLIHCGDHFQQTAYNLFFSEIVGRITVPLFFVISGYLFFQKYDGSWEDYKKKLKNRIHSLLIPYILWNLLAFIFYWIIGKTDPSQFYQSFWSVGYHGGHSPADGPLWFLRTLILILPIVPIIYWWNCHKLGWLSVVAYFCLFSEFNVFNSGSVIGVICFNLGTFLALNEEMIVDKLRKYQKYIFSSAWVLFIILTFVYIYQSEPNKWMLMTIISNGAIIFMIMPQYLNERINNFMKGLSKYSFFIFCFHEPLVSYMSKINSNIFGDANIGYTITVICITTICILVYKLCPHKVLQLLCGGR